MLFNAGSELLSSKKRRFILIASVVASLAFGSLLFGCGAEEPQTQKLAEPVQVLVAEVRQEDVPISKEWVGVTEGLVNAQIRAQVSGYLVEQAYREGQQVEQGQVLFRIDQRELSAAMAEARQKLDDALAQHETSKATLERMERLYKVNAVSKQILDEARGNEKSRRAEVGAAQAALEQASIELRFTEIASPIKGIAGMAQAQLGDLVGPMGEPLTTVSTLDPIKVYVSLSEREYLQAASRRQEKSAASIPLTLTLADGSTYLYKGRLSFADRSVDPNTGTIKIATLFPNPDLLLRPGQFAKVRAMVRVERNALLIPQRAVNEVQGIYQVGIVSPQDKVKIRVVKLGEKVGQDWLVEEGIKPGERVIVEGFQKVKDGQQVKVASFQPQPSGETGAGPGGGAQVSRKAGGQPRP